MTDKQIRASMNFLAGWLDKASVGCLLVGMFQTNHMFGGFIGSMVFFVCMGAQTFGGKMSFTGAMTLVICMACGVFCIGLYLNHLKNKKRDLE